MKDTERPDVEWQVWAKHEKSISKVRGKSEQSISKSCSRSRLRDLKICHKELCIPRPPENGWLWPAAILKKSASWKYPKVIQLSLPTLGLESGPDWIWTGSSPFYWWFCNIFQFALDLSPYPSFIIVRHFGCICIGKSFDFTWFYIILSLLI